MGRVLCTLLYYGYHIHNPYIHSNQTFVGPEKGNICQSKKARVCNIVCNSHVAFGEVLKRLSVPLWFSWVVGPGIGHAVICCFVFGGQVCTCTTDIKCCETLMIW